MSVDTQLVGGYTSTPVVGTVGFVILFFLLIPVRMWIWGFYRRRHNSRRGSD